MKRDTNGNNIRWFGWKVHAVCDSKSELPLDIINEYQGMPVIALNLKGTKVPPEGMNSKFEPICSAGYPLMYYGKDGNYLKFRCSHMTGKCDCPFGTAWCSNSNYGYTKKFNINDNPRLLGYSYRGSEQWQ